MQTGSRLLFWSQRTILFFIFENGAIKNSNLMDYRIPTSSDVPMIDVMLVEIPSSDGIYGLRHVGEPPIIPTLAAIANAIYNATGVRFYKLPMSPEEVLKGIKQRLRS